MVVVQNNVVEFRFLRPEARTVCVVGDFTGWRCGQMPMTWSQECWKLRLRLPSGVFRFRYLADGQWFTDYAAHGVEFGPFGLDSVLKVLPATNCLSEEENPAMAVHAIDARIGLPAASQMARLTAGLLSGCGA